MPGYGLGMTLTTLVLWGVLGCTSVLGLEELEQLPEGFPLEVGAPTGHVTRSEGGLVAADLVFQKADDARAHWKKLRADAEGSGWTVVTEGREGKRDRVVLEGTQGRLELGCCLERADRQHLMFVSWWPAD